MSVVSELEIRLFAGIARLQQDMDRAQQTVAGAMSRISASVGNAMNLIKGFAAVLAVGAFVQFIKGGIDAADAMDELREKTGLLMEDVAGVRLIFQREGFGDQELVVSMSKLSKAITEGGGALGALKISTKDASGEFRSTKAVLYDVADRFAAMDNGAQKSALAMEIFGKSGVALIPMLNGGSDGMREMAEMAEKLGLVISQETATAAGDFNDTLFLISQGSQGVAQGIAAELLPTLNSLASSFLTGMTSGQKLSNTAAVLGGALKILYTVAVVVFEVFMTTGRAIGAAAAMTVSVLQGNFKEAAAIYKAHGEEGAASLAASAKMITDAWDGTGEAAVAAAAKSLGAQKDLLAAQKEREAAEKKAAAEHAASMKAAQDYLTGLKVETAQVGLSADQVKMMAAARAAAKAPTAELRMEIMRAALALDIETKAFAASEASIKSVLEATQALSDSRASEYAAIAGEVQAGKDAIATYGLSKGAIEALTLARMEDRLARRGPQDLDLDEAEANHLMKMIALQKEKTQSALSFDELEKQKKTNEAMVADYQKTVDKYDDVFRTGFADMLNHGTSSWKSFNTSLLTTFKTTVADQIYKMLAQPFVIKMVGSLLGVTGASAAQAAGGAVGTAISGAGVAGSVASLSGMAGVLGSIGGIATGALQTAGALLTGQIAIGQTLSAGLSALASGSAAGAIAGLSSVIGTLGPIGLGIAGGVALLQKAFGHGPKEVTGTTLTGTLTPDGASAATVDSWKKKGGWFSSSKTGKDTTWFTAEQNDALAKSYKSILDISKVFGETLGVSTDALASRVQKLNVDLTGLKTEAEQMAAITKFFEGVADTVASELVPGLSKFQAEGESLSATLQRVATNYANLDTVLASMGTSFGAVGVSSIEARERFINAAGGMESLASGVSYFQQNILNDADRLAPVQKQLSAAMAELGLSSITTKDQLKERILGIDKTTETGATEFAKLLALAPAFKLVSDAAEAQVAAQAAVAEALATTNRGYQDQINQLLAAREGQAAIRALEITGMDASTIALYDRLAALKAEDEALANAAAEQKAAAEAAKAAAEALASTNAGYQQQIDQLLAARQGEAAVRALEVVGMDSTTVALYDRLAALKAEDVAAQSAKAAAEALATANSGYQKQIDALLAARQGEAAVRALEIAGMDSTTAALYDRLAALKAEDEAIAASAKLNADIASAWAANYEKQQQAQQQAQQAAAQAAEQLAGQRADKELILFNLTHTAAEQLAHKRELERASMDASVWAIQEQINAQEDLASAVQIAADAIKAAADKAAAVASERAGIERDMLTLKGDTAALRALELAALAPANRAAKEAYWALQDKTDADRKAAEMAAQFAQAQQQAAEQAKAAAAALKSAWQSVADTFTEEVRRIRGLIDGNGAQTYAAAQSAFAIATGQARAGDQEAAKLLPGLSKAMLDLAEANAVTSFDLRLARAQAAASLTETRGMLTSQFGLSLPSFDVGTDYISRTGLALVHEGEKITPAASNTPYTEQSGSDEAVRVLQEEVEELRGVVERGLYQIARNTSDLKDVFDNAANGFVPFAVAVKGVVKTEEVTA